MSNVTDPKRPSAPQPKVKARPNRNQPGRTTSLAKRVRSGHDRYKGTGR